MAGKAGRRATGAADGPASVAVAAWLSAVIAGDSAAPPPLDSAALALLRHGRLTALAASTASGDPRLAGVARDAFALAMLAQHAAAAAVAVLEAGGIETLTLKGPAFAVQILDDAALRPSGDVDLLVRRADLPAVRRACATAGMRGALHYPAWYEERWHDHAAFSGPPGARLVTVEVHWDIVRPGLSRLPLDQVFASRVDVACGGETLPAAALPWQAVFAAAHAAQHFFDGRGLLDVALAGRRLDRSGWATAVEAARRSRLGPALYYACDLLARWLDWRLPEGVAGLRPAAAQDRLVRRFLRDWSPWRAIDSRSIQVAKFGTPLAISSRAAGMAGLAVSVTDRPNVCTDIDRWVRSRRRR